MKPVTIPRASEALSVSPQMLRRYLGMGMPAAGIGARGHVLVDVDACAAWIATQVAGDGGHGGQRQGSGRPRADGAGPADSDEPTARTHAHAPAGAPCSPGSPGASGPELEDALRDPASLVRALGRISFADTRRLRDGLRAAEELAAHQVRMGQLVNAREHAQALARVMALVRRRLDELPARASRALADALRLPKAKAGAAREVLEEEVARLCGMIACAGDGTPPIQPAPGARTPPRAKRRKKKS